MKKIAGLIFILVFVLGTELFSQDNPFEDLSRPEKSTLAMDLNNKMKPRNPTVSFLKKEILSRFESSMDSLNNSHFHQALGLEYLVRFSDATATRSSINMQAQFVYDNLDRNRLLNSDSARYFKLMFHNTYYDVFQALDSFMGPSARKRNLGRYNFRIGRFYLPHGLNLQTDTHATLLQLSNEMHFGYDRDWYTGFYGALNENLKYDLYWMLGSGHDAVYKKQKGLMGMRVSLAGKFLYEKGLEAGLSIVSGERLAHDSMLFGRHIQTSRLAFDYRQTTTRRSGTVRSTLEVSGGKDDRQNVAGALFQIDHTDRERKNGLALQLRYMDRHGLPRVMVKDHRGQDGVETTADFEITRFLINDVNGNRMKWVKLLFSQPLGPSINQRDARIILQFYSYW
ncbi:MAG: hypothetical protein ACOYXC_03040 [Candidatus Rifleibacteriota bacterium]